MRSANQDGFSFGALELEEIVLHPYLFSSRHAVSFDGDDGDVEGGVAAVALT